MMSVIKKIFIQLNRAGKLGRIQKAEKLKKCKADKLTISLNISKTMRPKMTIRSNLPNISCMAEMYQIYIDGCRGI